MRLRISEMLQKAAAAPKEQRVEVLRGFAQRDQSFLAFVNLAVGPVKFNFEDGWKPKYTPCEFHDQDGSLHQQLRFLSKFLVGGAHPNLSPERRKLLFIQMLEGIHPDDAEFMVLAKDKRLPYKLTRKLMTEAFPSAFGEEEAA